MSSQNTSITNVCQGEFTPPTKDIEYRDLTMLGFPGYCVGEDGSVWSRKYRGSQKSKLWKRLCWPIPKFSKYATVIFRYGKIYYFRLVHRLVLEAFVGPCPDGMEGRHLDGNSKNNSAKNLAWGTTLTNMADKKIHGTQLMGSQIKNARLLERDIEIIKSLANDGVPLSIIGRAFGVDWTTVQGVLGGKAWGHVKTKFG